MNKSLTGDAFVELRIQKEENEKEERMRRTATPIKLSEIWNESDSNRFVVSGEAIKMDCSFMAKWYIVVSKI